MKIISIRNLAAVVRTAARGVAVSFGRVAILCGLLCVLSASDACGQKVFDRLKLGKLLPKPSKPGIRISDYESYSGTQRDGRHDRVRSDNAPDFNNDIILPKNVTSHKEQIIKRKSYIVSYNPDTRQPNWSAWHLTASHADGPYKRKQLNIDGNYLEDEPSVKGRQYLNDWQGISGYDHGHMCPSGDNKWSLEAMRQTFFLSNMCVQNSALNQGPWEHLESTCRQWAKKYGDIHIVCGPIYYSKAYKRGGTRRRLAVPDAFFKVVMRAGANPQAIGFIYQNVTPIDNDKMLSHVVTVDEVERITGLDFFSTLPDKVENAIESHADLRQWKTK